MPEQLQLRRRGTIFLFLVLPSFLFLLLGERFPRSLIFGLLRRPLLHLFNGKRFSPFEVRAAGYERLLPLLYSPLEEGSLNGTVRVPVDPK